MKRFLAGVLTLLIIIGSCPLLSVLADAKATLKAENDASVGDGELLGSIKIFQTQVSSDVNEYKNTTFDLKPSDGSALDLRGYSGFKFWVKSVSTTDIKICVTINSSVELKAQAGMVYYLQNNNSSNNKYTFDNSTAALTIPGGFIGYVTIPFASVLGSLSADNLSAVTGMTLAVNSYDLGTNSLWVDSISVYADANREVKSLYTFEENAVGATLNAGVMSLCTDSLGNGLLQVTKGTATSGEGALKFSFSVSDRNFTKYEGFRVFVNNDKNTQTEFRIKATPGARGISGRAYLREDEYGNVTELTFADDGKILVPANFKGYLYFPFKSFGQYASGNPNINISNIDSMYVRIMNIAQLGNDCVYFDDVSAYKETPEIYSIEQSDLSNNKITSTTIDLSVSNSALKLKFKDNESSAKFDTLKFNICAQKSSNKRDVSGYSYIGMYLRTDGESNDKVTVRFKLNAGIQAYWKAGVPFVLVDAATGEKTNGTTTRRSGASIAQYNNENAIGVTVPGGFEGSLYIAIPTGSQIGTYDSAGVSPYDTTKAEQLYVLFDRDQAANRNFVIDSVGFYHETGGIRTARTRVLKEFTADNIPYTFENGTTKGITFGSGFSTSEVADTLNGKQLKIVGAEDAMTSVAFRNVTFSVKNPDGSVRDVTDKKGITFYVETDGNLEDIIYIRPKWSAGLRVMLKKGAQYYLKDAANGTITEYYTAERTIYPTGLDNYKYERAVSIALPGGFKGYVYIPFVEAKYLSTYDGQNTETSIAERLNYKKMSDFQFMFDADAISKRTVYLDNVGLYDEEIVPTPVNKEILYTFDENTIGLISSDAQLLLNVSDTYKYGESGKSLKISQSQNMATSDGERRVKLTLRYPRVNGKVSDFTGYTGIKMWVKFDDTNNGTVRLRPKFNIGDQSRGLANRPYYTVNDNGKIGTGFFKDGGFVDISSSFSGYIYIPFSSLGCWNSSVKINLATADSMEILVNSAMLGNSALYLDEICLYTESPVIYDGIDETGAGMFYDFEKNSLAGISSDEVLSTKISSEYSANDSNYCLEIIQKSYDETNPIRQINALANYTGKSRDVSLESGLAFWIKCDSGDGVKTNHVQLMIQMDAPSRSWFLNGQPYYLVDENGLAKKYYFSKDTGGAGVIKIHDSFEGYVYVPFTSMSVIDKTTELDLTKLNKVIFHIRSQYLYDRAIYIDNIQSYTQDPTVDNSSIDYKYVMNFDDMSRQIDLNEKVTTTGKSTVIELSDKYSQKGNSLKVTTTYKTEGKVTDGDNIEFSMLNYDQSVRDISEYMGIRFWVKAVDKSGGKNKTPVKLRVQANMPSRCYATVRSQYFFYSGGEFGEIAKFTGESDPTGIVSIDRGYEGYIYIPMTDMSLFDSKQEFDFAQLKQLFLYAVSNSLIDAELYIDDMAFFDSKELPPMNYPGDPNYNPDNDSMLKKILKIIGGKYPTGSDDTSNDSSDSSSSTPDDTTTDNTVNTPSTEENNEGFARIYIYLICLLPILVAITIFVLYKKKILFNKNQNKR